MQSDKAMIKLKTPKYLVTVPFEKSGDDSTIAPIIPENIKKLLGEPTLMAGEYLGDYQEMMDQFAVALKPKDLIEWWWVRDVVDLTWEIVRYRRLRGAAMRARQTRALEDAMFRIMRAQGQANARSIAEGIASDYESLGGEAVEDGIRRRLNSVYFDPLAVVGAAFMEQVEAVERVDRMIASATARRDGVIRDIERRRETFARRMRDVIDIVQEPPMSPVSTKNSSAVVAQA
jgi:hypothetical protein